jgi:hypothetical protein
MSATEGKSPEIFLDQEKDSDKILESTGRFFILKELLKEGK